MEIVFSRHAEKKFEVLARHDVRIERALVENAVRNPHLVDPSRMPLLIAQISLDSTHVLRVVYKQEGDKIFIITFYPGRTTQYGNHPKT